MIIMTRFKTPTNENLKIENLILINHICPDMIAEKKDNYLGFLAL